VKKIIVIFLVLFSLILFSFNIPRYIGSNDVEIEFENLDGYFNGVAIKNKKINGLDFEEGVHSLRLVGSYQEFLFKVIIDTIPPTSTIFTTRDPNLVILESEVLKINYENRINFFGEKITGSFKRDEKAPFLFCNIDEAKNMGGFSIVPPSISNITPLDSKTPISGINNKNILLSSKSPYKIVGRVVIPEKAVLFFEPGVELKSIGKSGITVKGTVYIPENVSFSGYISFDVSENGKFVSKTKNFDGEISSDGGQLVYIENAHLENVNISKTNVVVIKNSVISNINAKHIAFLVLENSTITNLNISNTREVILNNIDSTNSRVEGLTNINIYNLISRSLVVSDFSNIVIRFSQIEKVTFERGVYFHGKNVEFASLKLNTSCVGKFYKAKIEKLETLKSKLLKRLVEIENIVSDKKSTIEDY